MNTKYIELLFTGPPSVEIGSFVSVLDDLGRPIQIGEWYHDGDYWRYQIPVELVPRLVVPAGAVVLGGKPRPGGNQSKEAATETRASGKDAQSVRRELKERVMARRKEAEDVEAARATWPVCAEGCGNKFDPAQDQLVDCSGCGASKCTAVCIPSEAFPCIDCQALETSGSGKGGSEASASQPNPFGAAMFDGQVSHKPRESGGPVIVSAQEGDEEEEDMDQDEDEQEDMDA